MQSSHLVFIVLLIASAVPVHCNHVIMANQHQYQPAQHHPEEDVPKHPIQDLFTSGMELALKHCQLQFQQDPWNCPTKDFLAKQQNPTLDRESAFVQSITVAALAYSMAKNCSGGLGKEEKSSFCRCAFMKEMNGVQDIYNCFTDIDGAENELSQIINNLSGDQVAYDPQGVMLLQNSRAGLYTVMNSVQKTCRCHGFSGSCSISTCWMALDSFTKIASDLKTLYTFAVPLDLQNSMKMDHVLLADGEMAYVDDSPNYCSSSSAKEAKQSSWDSVRGRRCATSLSTEEEKATCKQLCMDCGLRMRWQEVVAKRSCNCKFNWSLVNVTCDVCEETIKEFYCS